VIKDSTVRLCEIGTGISEAGPGKRVPIFLLCQRRRASEFLFWTGTQTNTGELGPSLGIWQGSVPAATIVA
jgi:hypothetical protein